MGTRNHGTTLCMDTWQYNRKLMLINFCFTNFIGAISFTGYYPTEYFYFKDFMHLRNAELFYGLSWVFLSSSGVFSSLIGSYYADTTKNVRLLFMVTNILSIIGNIMYTLYYSPYIVLFGQLIIGTGAARIVACAGEISRVYESQQLTQKFFLISIFSTLGTVFGPSSVYLFRLIDINLYGWRIQVGNMIGVTLVFLNIIHAILNYFTLYNVSQAHTIKKSVSERFSSKENQVLLDNDEFIEKETMDGENDVTFHELYMLSLKTIAKNKYIMFLLYLSFYTTFLRGIIHLLVPVKAAVYNDWKQAELATVILIGSCGGGVPIAVISTFLARCINDFYLYLSSIILLLLPLLLLIIVPKGVTDTKTLFYVIVIANSMSSALFHVLSRSMLAKFVPENVQTIIEAIRNSLFELSYMFGGLLLRVTLSYLSESMILFSVLLFLSMVWYLCHFKVYLDIQDVQVKSK